MSGIKWALFFVIVLVMPLRAALAQQSGGETDLAKQTQNPVADLTTVPFQFNWYTGGGLGDRTMQVLNFQPVLPLPLNGSTNVIARFVAPIMNIPTGSGTRSSGLGDLQAQLFFTPAQPGSMIWGVGPVLSFPTATNDVVATGQFAAGPTAVALKMTGPWVIGGLANHLWRVAGGETTPAINVTLIQPIINYNFSRGWSLNFVPIITANWAAPSGEEWTVPLGGGVSKVLAIGRQPASLGLHYYHNVERPSTAGEDQVRLVFAFLYPKPPASK